MPSTNGTVHPGGRLFRNNQIKNELSASVTSECTRRNSNLSSTRWLCCAKLAAVALSFLYANPYLPVIGDLEFNFVSATFYIALIGLPPKFGWTIPCLVVGFWLTPIIFAFRVNGSFAEDLTTAIAGGMIGLTFGLVLDIQHHRAIGQAAEIDRTGPLPDTTNGESIGEQRPLLTAAPTPPDMRVRIRRFGEVEQVRSRDS